MQHSNSIKRFDHLFNSFVKVNQNLEVEQENGKINNLQIH